MIDITEQHYKIGTNKPFYVFRLGSGRKSLDGSNAANSMGLADFIINEFDREYGHGHETGDIISMFKVDLLGKPTGDYQALGGARNTMPVKDLKPVGVTLRYKSSNGKSLWYSFQKQSGNDYKAEFVKSIKVSFLEGSPQAQKAFKKSFDDEKKKYEKEHEIYQKELTKNPNMYMIQPPPMPKEPNTNLGYYGTKFVAQLIRDIFKITPKQDLTA